MITGGIYIDVSGGIYRIYGALRGADLWRLYHKVRQKTPYFINTGNYKTGAQADALGGYYAACIHEHLQEAGGADVLFGPAYKGIPLVVTAAASLTGTTERTIPMPSTGRKRRITAKAAIWWGAKIQDGQRIAIVEDVVTAGTAVRETIALFQTIAHVKINAAVCYRRPDGEGHRREICTG